MGWFIHHVNIQAYDVPEAAAFYRDVIGLKDGVWVYPEAVGEVGHSPESIAAFGSQNRGLHICRAINEFPLNNKLFHNPTIGGHFAVNVPDADGVKARLEAAGHIVSDAGEYAMAGVRQLYVYDPFQNVIEINQITDASGGPAPGAGEAHGERWEAGDWSLHHVNLPAYDVRRTAAFFQDMVGLEEGRWRYPESSPITEMAADTTALALFGDDNRGLHIVKPQSDFAKRNGFDHNPTIGGHFAIQVKDLEPVIQRLNDADVPYTDAGQYAMAGMRQVYCYDPSMNFVEINQAV